MMYPLVCELQDDGFCVSMVCRVLGFSKQGFYKWKKKVYSDRDWDDAHMVNRIIDIHQADPSFGYRLICDELNDQGIKIGESRVHRLCKEHNIVSVIVRKRKGKRKPGPVVHDDLLQRNFTADNVDEKWVTDITEHPTMEGKLYLCTFKDLFSNRIVGYSMGPRMTADLCVNALDYAVAARKPVNTIAHSDRGSQYSSNEYLARLDEYGLRGSMGRVGAAGDNAAAENFFSLLQVNVLDLQVWETRDQLRAAITEWIETKYNRRRKQRRLNKQTPIQYEQAAKAA
jgi:putative transposase